MSNNVLPPKERRLLTDALGEIATAAAVPIMSAYRTNPRVLSKDDGSPVTEVDLAAEEIILARVSSLLPGVPIVAEERLARERPPEISDMLALVDPLDGTKEFLNGSEEFTLNIAL